MTNNVNRRTALMLAGVSALLGCIPSGYDQIDADDPDVQLLKKNHLRYDQFRTLFIKRFNFLPEVIAVCENDIGVQKAVRLANQLNMRISAKSGGHSFEGLSLNNDGMAIDVSKINHLAGC